MSSLLLISGLIVLVGIIVIATILIIKKNRDESVRKSLATKLLLVRIPQISADKQTTYKEEINFTEQLFSILAGNTEGTTLEAAVHHVGEEIYFYISTHEKLVPFLSRQIEGVFKDAHVEEVVEYNIFQPQGYTAGAYLVQDEHYALPVRTYIEAEGDTFSPIIGAFSRINELGEGAAIQVCIRPAEGSHKKNIKTIIENLKKGIPFKELSSQKFLELKDFKEVFSSGEKDGAVENQPVDESMVHALEKKISKPLIEVNLRYIVSTTNQSNTDAIFAGITGSFSQFEAPLRNKFKIVSAKNIKKFAYQFIFREFDEGQSMILNSEELASIFHLPTSTMLSPKIKWLKSKDAPAPVDTPTQGTKLGENVFRGVTRPVYITDEDRRRHLYIVGQTGTGKSALMTNMAVDDIRHGKGVCVIDPHGELIDAILGCIPPERAQDVIVFDPGNMHRPIGLNMLEFDFSRPEEKTFIVNEIQGIFNKLFTAETMGPMFEQYMRNALLLLMEDSVYEPATLVEVPRIFTDDEFRKRKLARITNPVVLDFWQKEAMKVTGEASLNSMAPYITSKFNNFIANDYVRPIIGQTKSSFKFRQIMDEKKILLVSLSKGKIGDINSELLGMLVVGKLLLAAFSRVDISQEQRTDFNVYIDEFQNFTTDSIAIILSEARKYKLNLTIAHQFIAQLEQKIRDAVFGNVGSMVVFRVGAQDTEFLVKQFEPVFLQNDLMNIDNLNAYIRLLIKGQTSKPFNIKTPLYPQQDHTMIQKLKEASSTQYGIDRQTVEMDILNRLRS
ncbi:MAG: DUF87 domain-containing protein [Candidatus Paceibacterota bacterium]